jgi:hypothetical protein
VPDGVRLAAAVRAKPGALPASPPIRTADRPKVLAAIDAWLAWLDGRISVPAEGATSPWSAERMEYAFAVAAPTSGGERVLVATEYSQEHLDWHSFDRSPAPRWVQPTTKVHGRRWYGRRSVARQLPRHARGTWWEFEDGQVNLARSTPARLTCCGCSSSASRRLWE